MVAISLVLFDVFALRLRDLYRGRNAMLTVSRFMK